MNAEDNIKTVQAAYEAFGRGDIPAVLDALTDDIDWASETDSTEAPWYGVKHGKAEVGQFFEALGSTMEIEEFTPVAVAANETDVLTVVNYRAKARTTGRTAVMQIHHYFKFRDGKIAYYRGSEDSAQSVAVLRP